MTEHTPDREALDAAAALTVALSGMQEELKAVNERQDSADRRSHRNRLYAVLALALVVVDLTSTVIAVIAVTVALHASATVAQLHDTQVAACQSGNQTRANEIALWEHIYSLAGVSKAPPKQRKADNELIAYIRRTFAPRNCKSLYRLDR